MQMYCNQLAVEAAWLVSSGVMTQCQYRHLIERRSVKVLRRGCRENVALVAYESLPQRFKDKVLQLVDNPYETVKVNILSQYIEHDAVVSRWFDDYRLPDGRHLPEARRAEYYANAIVLRAVARLTEFRRAKGETDAWSGVAEAIAALDPNKFPVNLPDNERRLRDKVKQYQKEGNECLIHTAYRNGQRNAAKVSGNEEQSILATLISDPRNLDDAQVARLYNDVAAKLGWASISRSTVANWRTRLDSLTYARRHGGNAFNNRKAMQVRRSAPSAPLLMWCMDGWDIELMYQKRTGSRTTYHNRLTMVVVLDTFCNYPIGYAIGEQESPALIREALRSAERHCEQLFGRMYQTNQLQSDNYQIKNLTPLYARLADKVTPAAVGNAKSKIVERWFLTFNKKYCQTQPNWSGFGITSRRENQPNVDFLNKYRTQFPDFAGVCEQVVSMMERERASLRAKYVGGFGLLPEERRLPMSQKQYLLAFGVRTDDTNLLQGCGIVKQIEGRKYHYDCFDPDFRRHASVRWHVLYDPTDMSRALAVNDDQTLQFELEEKYIQPMALADRKEGDAAELKRIFDYNERQRQTISNELGQFQQTARQLTEKHRELETLQKLLITDSRGQHKDRRNEERLKELPEAAVFELTEPQGYSAADTFDLY